MLGCAFCATASAVSLDDAVIGFADFESGEGVVVGTQEAYLTTSTLESGDVQLVLGNSHYFNSKASSGRTRMTITMVLDASKVTLPAAGTSASIIKDNGSGWGLGVNSNGALTGTWSTNTAYYTSRASIGSSGLLTITITTGDTTNGTNIFLGNDGAPSASTSGNNGNLKGSFNSSTLVVNSGYVDAIQKLYVFNSNLTNAEVATVAQAVEAVPEPSTATLSLLALAGLAVRRRRA